MDLFALIILFISAAVGSFYGSLMGGGGLLRIPVMLIFGVPPHVAIATNKVAALGTALSGIHKFGKSKKIDYRVAAFLMGFLIVGSFIGANMLVVTEEAFLENVIIIFLVAMLIITSVKSRLGVVKTVEKIGRNRWIIGGIVGLFVGVYHGFFGVATGTIASFFLLAVFGHTFLESAGTRKLMFMPSAAVILVVFIMNNLIDWAIAVALFSGSMLGGYFGAHYFIKKGDRWARRIFIVVVTIMIVNLVFF